VTPDENDIGDDSLNCALEFHDCRVTSITSGDGTISLNFSAAYLHKSDGVPGVDDGSGWVQQGKLEFVNARELGAVDIGEGWMVGGTLAVQSRQPMSMLPVPFDASAGVSATFSFNNGVDVHLTAEATHLTLTGDAEFVEEFRRT
jgi:hypothetical protein